MNEIQAIQAITSVDSCKVKHSYRRGQVTKLKAKIEEIHGRALRDIRITELQVLKQDLTRETDLHGALQSQYEALLASKATQQELAEEECAGEEYKYAHRLLLQGLVDLVTYQKAVSSTRTQQSGQH